MSELVYRLLEGAFILGFAVLLAALIVARFKAEAEHGIYSSDTAPPETKTNCPACGARVPVASDVCDYCEESLTDDTPDYGWVDE